jgi:DNA-binding NarL/FixJ family response regulator
MRRLYPEKVLVQKNTAAIAVGFAEVQQQLLDPATRTAATPLPLTNRERETAELVAAGLSNKQIAEAMTLSVRTIEGNIYKACAKLDLADRTELAQLMSQLSHRGPTPASVPRRGSGATGRPAAKALPIVDP